MNASSKAWRARLTWLPSELISHSFSAFDSNQSSLQNLITRCILSLVKRLFFCSVYVFVFNYVRTLGGGD